MCLLKETHLPLPSSLWSRGDLKFSLLCWQWMCSGRLEKNHTLSSSWCDWSLKVSWRWDVGTMTETWVLLQCRFEKKHEERGGSAVRMPGALAADLGSAPSTHEVASSHLDETHKHEESDANSCPVDARSDGGSEQSTCSLVGQAKWLFVYESTFTKFPQAVLENGILQSLPPECLHRCAAPCLAKVEF